MCQGLRLPLPLGDVGDAAVQWHAQLLELSHVNPSHLQHEHAVTGKLQVLAMRTSHTTLERASLQKHCPQANTIKATAAQHVAAPTSRRRASKRSP